jgi:phage terminase small subunit
MADFGALNPRQRRFLVALVANATVRDAAQAAGIGERTAWRYLAEPSVKAALTERQDAVLGHVSRRLASEMGAALDVLCGIMRNTAANDAARVSAARAVLDSGLRLAELVTLAERVAELEARMEEEER